MDCPDGQCVLVRPATGRRAGKIAGGGIRHEVVKFDPKMGQTMPMGDGTFDWHRVVLLSSSYQECLRYAKWHAAGCVDEFRFIEGSK